MEQHEPSQPPMGEQERLSRGVWMTRSQHWAAVYAEADWRQRENWRAFAAMVANLVIPLLLLAAAEIAMRRGAAWLPASGGSWHHAAIKVTFGWMFVRFSEWVFRDLIDDVRSILAPINDDDEGW